MVVGTLVGRLTPPSRMRLSTREKGKKGKKEKGKREKGKGIKRKVGTG